ncbi:hypothetical protein [Thalassotalea ganghwensis]
MKKTASAIFVLAISFSGLGQANDSLSLQELTGDTRAKSFNQHKPWKDLQDTFLAMNDPDRYAWQLFVSLNWPGNDKNCRPDKNKVLGDNGLTTWQMWRSREETFLENAIKPKSWKKACADGAFYTPPAGDTSNIFDEEVRMNKSAYHFIRDNKLYSLDEQERLAAQGVTDIDFPIGAKEIKAHWVKIEETDKPRYHWIEVERDEQLMLFGLSALHIISKDMPTWFWSTFEHVDNENYWPTIYPESFRGWVVASKDSVACPASQLDCNELPSGFGLEGTKWENYRLRGTQTDWVDNRGRATVLTNSQIEGPFDQETMSCLTCHALAVKGETGPAMPIPPVQAEVNDQGRPLGHIGPVDPSLFEGQQFIGLDYVWALRHAQREQ